MHYSIDAKDAEYRMQQDELFGIGYSELRHLEEQADGSSLELF